MRKTVAVDSTSNAPPLVGGCIFLLVLCGIFYAALYYFSHGLAALRSEQGFVLSVGFCAVFCLYIGMSGWRVTRRLWVGPVLHTAVAAGLLCWDIPWEYLRQDADIVLLILGGVLGATALGSVWGRLRQKRA